MIVVSLERKDQHRINPRTCLPKWDKAQRCCKGHILTCILSLIGRYMYGLFGHPVHAQVVEEFNPRILECWDHPQKRGNHIVSKVDKCGHVVEMLGVRCRTARENYGWRETAGIVYSSDRRRKKCAHYSKPAAQQSSAPKTWPTGKSTEQKIH